MLSAGEFLTAVREDGVEGVAGGDGGDGRDGGGGMEAASDAWGGQGSAQWRVYER